MSYNLALNHATVYEKPDLTTLIKSGVNSSENITVKIFGVTQILYFPAKYNLLRLSWWHLFLPP